MIPLSVPNLSAREKELVMKSLDDNWVSSAGPDITAFEQAFARRMGGGLAVAVSSGTAALHLALLVLDIGPGDLVVAPNLTFVATLNAISYVGAEPVLVDCDPQTLQMDVSLIEAFLEQECRFQDGQCRRISDGKPVKALLPVHVLGYPVAMGGLMQVARAKGIPVVEDAAESLGTMIGDQPAGSMGLLSCHSFNGNKIITTGGGGMVWTPDRYLADRVRHLSTQARSFSAEYIHDAVGYNYRMPNLNAALGLAQFERLDEMVDRKREIYGYYRERLKGLPIRFPAFAEDVSPNHWLVTLLSPEARHLEEVLAVQQIQSRKLWLPMNRLPMYRECTYLSEQDHSFLAYEHSLSVPCSTGMSFGEMETVANAISRYFQS